MQYKQPGALLAPGAKSWLLTLGVVSIALLAPLASIRNNPTLLHSYIDFLFYSTIQEQFSSQFWQGEWYPRWLAGANAGLGSPVFLFYGPVTFYIGSLLRFLHGIDPYGTLQLVVNMWLAVVCSAFAFFAWVRHHLPVSVARAGALLYALHPFKLTLIYEDFGIAQLWTLVWLPFVLLACDRIITGKPCGAALFSLFSALILLTRLPTMLIFGWIPLAYLACFAPRGDRWRCVALGLTGMLLACALSAIYLLPMQENMGNISIPAFHEGYYDFRHNFNSLRSYFGVLFLAVPALLYYWRCLPQKRFSLLDKHFARFWLAVMALVFFMVTPLSAWLWEWIKPLQSLQFPFRWLTVALVPASVLVVPWARYDKRKEYIWLIGIAYVLIIVPAIDSLYAPTVGKESSAMERERMIVPPEYQTVWMQAKPHTSGYAQYETFLYSLLENPDKVYTGLSGDAHIRVKVISPRALRVTADIASPEARITLRRFYYPGYRITPPSSGVSLAPEGILGLAGITLARGKYDMVISWPSYAGEQLGLWISLVSLAIIIAMAASAASAKPKTGDVPEAASERYDSQENAS